MAYKARKRKVKKNVPEGKAFVHSTFNNTIVTLTDKDGNVLQELTPVIDNEITGISSKAWNKITTGMENVILKYSLSKVNT